MIMKMRQFTAIILCIGFAFMTSCKPRNTDADVQAKVSEVLNSIPGISADVKDGVVTLSGSVADDATKTSAEDLAKAAPGVKSVTNDIIVAPAAAPAAATNGAPFSADDQLKAGIATAVKDFPGINTQVDNGVIKVSGEISSAKWKTLKMALDALNPKKVDASGLKIK
jgi:hypothetical protein